MTDRHVGQIVNDGQFRWEVYDIRADGTVCMREVGKANELDYSQTCTWRGQSFHGFKRRIYCDDYVLSGTTRCRKHQE